MNHLKPLFIKGHIDGSPVARMLVDGGAKGVMRVELTVGNKTLATAFFVAEVQGNYNVILGQIGRASCRERVCLYV